MCVLMLSKVFGINCLWFSTPSPHHISRDVWKNAQAASKSLLKHCIFPRKQQQLMREVWVWTDGFEEVM